MARLTVVALVFAAALAARAQAADLAATKRVLAREMARAGAASGAYVVDAATGQELYAARPDVARMPASVEKLYTSATALLRYGRRRHDEDDGALGRAARRGRHDRRRRRPARRRRSDVRRRSGDGRWPTGSCRAAWTPSTAA